MSDGMEMSVDTTSVDSSPSVDRGASLQEQMTGDFFYDEGTDAVCDQFGNPQYDEQGNKITSLDTFKARQGGNQQQQSTQTAKPGEQAQPVAPKDKSISFDSLFEKDGKIDFDSVNDHTSRFNQFNYQSALFPKVDAGQQQNQQQPQQQPVDPKAAMQKEVGEYQSALESSLLAPLQNAYKDITAQYQAIGQEVPAYVYNVLNAQYLQQEKAVREAVEAKKEELREKVHQEELSQIKTTETMNKSKEIFSTVANELFPKTDATKRMDALNQLLFGYDQGGKFVRGYGADMIDHLFDLAHDGKQFKSTNDYQAAYQNWWVKFASNPNNIKRVAQSSFDRYIATKGFSAYRDSVRAAWEKEQKNRNKTTVQQTPAGRGSNSMSPDDTMKQLNGYLSTPNKRNM